MQISSFMVLVEILEIAGGCLMCSFESECSDFRNLKFSLHKFMIFAAKSHVFKPILSIQGKYPQPKKISIHSKTDRMILSSYLKRIKTICGNLWL